MSSQIKIKIDFQFRYVTYNIDISCVDVLASLVAMEARAGLVGYLEYSPVSGASQFTINGCYNNICPSVKTILFK